MKPRHFSNCSLKDPIIRRHNTNFRLKGSKAPEIDAPALFKAVCHFGENKLDDGSPAGPSEPTIARFREASERWPYARTAARTASVWQGPAPNAGPASAADRAESVEQEPSRRDPKMPSPVRRSDSLRPLSFGSRTPRSNARASSGTGTPRSASGIAWAVRGTPHRQPAGSPR